MLTTAPKPWARPQSVEEIARTQQPNEGRIRLSAKEAVALATLPQRLDAQRSIEGVVIGPDNRLRLRHEPTNGRRDARTGFVLYGPRKRLLGAVCRRKKLDEA